MISYVQGQPSAVLSLDSSASLNGNVTGADTYEFNTTATLTAVPAAGYVFTGWSGDASGTANPLDVLMDADKTIGATFNPDTNDDDDDGLTNYQEIVELGTNPALKDTDDDGLADGVETNTGIWVSATDTGTDPIDPDSDGDDLLDGHETNTDIWVLLTDTGTSPLDADSDDDGFEDRVEAVVESNPNDLLSVPTLIDSDTTIGVSELTYENAKIVVSNATLTIDGSHELSSVLVLDGGVITHTRQIEGFDLRVTGDLTIDEGGRIHADGKGHSLLGVSGSGRDYGGAGHGGIGGGYGNYPGGPTYGSLTEPTDHGSPGNGTYAGGALRIGVGGVLSIEGEISAAGLGEGWGSASGGSIFLEVDVLEGGGDVLAAGGTSTLRGGGAGGRIAVYYRDMSGFSGTIEAPGGDGNTPGGAGTVFLKNPVQLHGDLIVAGAQSGGALTPLASGLHTFDSLEVRDGGKFLVPEDAQLVLGTEVFGITDDGVIQIEGSVSYSGDPEGRFSSVEATQNGRILVNAQGSLHTETLRVSDGGYFTVGGEFEASILQILPGGRLILNAGEQFSTEGLPLELAGTLVLHCTAIFPSVHVMAGGLITHWRQVEGFDLRVTGDLTIDEGGRISADWQGPDWGQGPGAAENNDYGGAGHGGIGGSYSNSSGGPAYGSVTEPVDFGSAGNGGPGGGALRIGVGGVLSIEGEISAAGLGEGWGSASGGSIYLELDTLEGNGSISAPGGSSSIRGGGAGGRIAIYYRDKSGFSGRIEAPGGGGNQPGGAGTVFLKTPTQAHGDLIVTGGHSGGALTPLPSGTHTFDSLTVLDGARFHVPEDAQLVLGTEVFGIADDGEIRIEGSASYSGDPEGRFSSVEATQNGRILVNAQGSLHTETLRVSDGGSFTVGGEFEASSLQILPGGALTLNAGEQFSTEGLPLVLSGTLVLNCTASFPLVHVLNGGVITHSRVIKGFDLRVTGDLTIDEGGRISADGLGHSLLGITGSGRDYAGAGHGGKGGDYSGVSGGSTYGSVTEPVDHGSPGNGTYGGGALRINVGGVLHLEGEISAAGLGEGWGSASGGSVHLMTDTIQGGGTVAARGGTATIRGSGGGGRIAVYHQDMSGFSGIIEAQGGGGNYPGETGTVYLHGPDAAPFLSADTGLPEGLLTSDVPHVDLIFVSPISQASLMTGVQMWGKDGEVPILGIELQEKIAGRETYRVSFAPQLDGTYELTVGPLVFGTNGKPMDQDHDGVIGELFEDLVTTTFTVDRTGPKITRHQPGGDNAGTVDYMDLWFSEEVNGGSFGPDDVVITGPGGSIVVNSVSRIALNRYRIHFAAQTIYGDYSASTGPDVQDLAGNSMDQDRDGSNGEANEDVYTGTFSLVDVDLTVNNVQVTTPTLWTGEEVQVTWDGANQSGTPLLGSWTDAVYFSSDDVWDIDDISLGRVPHTGGLTSGETYTGSLESSLPIVPIGDYFLIVRADLFDEEKEGGNEANNIVAMPIHVDVHPLLAEGPTEAGSLNPGSNRVYSIQAESHDTLSVELSGLTATGAELYASYGNLPSRENYGWKGTAVGASNLHALVPTPLEGTYYVLVHGGQVDGTLGYQIGVTTPEIAVTGTTPSLHATERQCTMVISGAGFTSDTVVEFVASDGAVLLPESVQMRSSSELVVVLDLPNWDLGLYDLRVTKPGVAPYLASTAFEVVVGQANLKTNLILPDSFGRHWLQTIYIEYENTGTSSMDAPLIRLEGTDNALMTTDTELAQAFTRLNWNNYQIYDGISSKIDVLVSGSEATPGILQPGDKGQIEIKYCGVARPWNFSDRTLEFQVSVLDEGNSTMIDWSALKSEMKPTWWVGDDAWNAIWLNFVGIVGDDWADYLAFMNRTRPLFDAVAQDVAWGGSTQLPNCLSLFHLGPMAYDEDMQKIISLGFRMADGLNPIRNLASATDVAVSAPGLSLSFDRIYQQPISRRYQLGTLGRGWTHSWEMRLATNGDNDVAVYDVTGTPRIFTHDAPNTVIPLTGTLPSPGPNVTHQFHASEGDHGRLELKTDGSYELTELSGGITGFLADGKLSYVLDPNGNRISCSYTGSQLTGLTHSAGQQLELSYTGHGRIFTVTDPREAGDTDDHTVTYGYDPSGQYLTSVTAADGTSTDYTYETGGTTQQRHALTSITYPDTVSRHFAYNPEGWLEQTWTDLSEELLEFDYSDDGAVELTDLAGRSSTYRFAGSGHVVEVRDSAGNSLAYAYDSDYRLVAILGPNGETYAYGYDGRDNVSGIVDPMQHVTSLTYDPDTNGLASITDDRGNGMDYDYDAAGNLERITYEDDTHEDYTYYASGNVHTWTNRRRQVITFTYNGYGQVTTKDYDTTPDEIDYTYVYDTLGFLTSTIGPEGTTGYKFDRQTGLLDRIDYPGEQWFEYEYNDAGQRRTRTDQLGGVENYTYDSAGRLDIMTDENDSLIVDYDYYASGLLKLKTLGNGVYTTYDYTANGQIESLVNYQPDDTILSRFDYIYDNTGKRKSVTTLEGATQYGYDAIGQLTSVEYPGGRLVQYIYDAVGNREKVIDDGVTTDYVTNEMNQYDQVGGVTYTFDDDGNMETKTEGGVMTTYTWNPENRLVGVNSTTDTWSYGHGAFGTRVASDVNGTVKSYVVDPIGYGNLAAEYDSGGGLTVEYSHGYGLLSQDRGAMHYYTFDAIGSTSELTGSGGAAENWYRYDPFGVSLAGNEIVENSFGFVGQVGVMADSAGLSYMRARYYHSGESRFVSADPVGLSGGHENLYQYAFNRPTGVIDPSGLNCKYLEAWADSNDYLSAIGGEGGIVEEMGRRHNRLVGETPMMLHDLTKLSPIISTKGNPKNLKGFLGIFGRLEKLIGCYFRADKRGGDGDPVPPTKPGPNGGGGIREVIDPNDKLAPAGVGEGHYLEADGTLIYTVRFENQPTADAPAHIVRVTDTLDPNVDLSTLELKEIGFANEIISIPAGNREYHGQHAIAVDNEFVTGDLVVQIDVTLNVATREMEMTLTGVDPATGWFPEDFLLGFLYPNDDTGRGDGYLSYVIEPQAGLPSGTRIENKARIYFDWNDPIDTPLVFNTLDAAAPESSVTALPTMTLSEEFLIAWQGMDEAGGSGVAAYDINVRVDDGDWSLWLEGTTSFEEWFYGERGHNYSFYSVATDLVGHEEDVPAAADTTTFVAAAVLGRYVFYNDSIWDGNDPAANANDDAAIAPDKLALPTGEPATSANYSSYGRGLNGIMIDVDGMISGPALSDFLFRASDTPTTNSLLAAPEPLSIALRPGEGVDGSDRVTLLWADNNFDGIADPNEALANQWLEVTILSDTNGGSLGLAADEVFWFGSAVGETGDSGGTPDVTQEDLLLTAGNPHGFFDPAPIGDAHDYNRDGNVDALDVGLSRDHANQAAPPPSGAVLIDVGIHAVREGDSMAEIPVMVSGDQPVTDMTAVVQVGDGGPLVGGTPGPVVTGIGYAGSIWENAPGGLLPFSGSAGPIGQVVDPNASLPVTGETVQANGVLCTVALDLTGFLPGTYDLKLAGSPAGSTTLYNRATAMSTTVANGTFEIIGVIDYWRREHFPDDVDDPLKEETVWGHDADPDQDGMKNFMEYKLGSDPNIATTGAELLSVGTFSDGTGGFHTLIFRQRAYDPEGVACTAQGSTDLVNWHAGAGIMDVVSVTPLLPDGEFEEVVVRATLTGEDPPPAKYFMRLQVER